MARTTIRLIKIVLIRTRRTAVSPYSLQQKLDAEHEDEDASEVRLSKR